MNVNDVVAALRFETRNVHWEGDTLEALPWVTRRSYGPDANDVYAFELDASNVDQAISQELTHFAAMGQTFEWKVFSFDSPPDLVERLCKAGFEVGEKEALVLYDLADGLDAFMGPYPCEVQRIQRLDQLEEFKSVSDAAFGRDDLRTTNQLAEALRTGRKGHDGYIAHMDGKPVSVGRLYTNPRSAFAGLYGGGTHPEYRGLGCYRAMVAARAEDAAAAGSRYLLVDAMPTSLPILKRLGFVHVADSWPCISQTISKSSTI